MAQDIAHIRAELNELRTDIGAFFDRIEQHFASNPSAGPSKLPTHEDMAAKILRRRANAAMAKVEAAVQESKSELAKAEFGEFRWKVGQLKNALQFKRYKGSNEAPAADADWDSPGKYAAISVIDARAAALDGFQAAKELLALVSGTSSHTPKVDMGAPKVSTPIAAVASWEEVEIRFLSDERAEVIAGSGKATLNYAEFGLKDGRSGKPNRAWLTLRLMAEKGGTFPAVYGGPQWPKIEKRMQEIRKVLRACFGLTDDPLTYGKTSGYQARFKICCGPSYKS